MCTTSYDPTNDQVVVIETTGQYQSDIFFFRELGEGPIPTELVKGELPPQVKDLEQFVCRVYYLTGPTTLPTLRWELFPSTNLEGDILPPTHALP